MRKIVVCVAAVLLAGCSDVVEERFFPAMPPELQDCRVFYVQNRSGNAMTVVRCPNSVTTATVTSGKTKQTSVVIDGV